jgi:hypothetical protein
MLFSQADSRAKIMNLPYTAVARYFKGFGCREEIRNPGKRSQCVPILLGVRSEGNEAKKDDLLNDCLRQLVGS